MKLLYIKNLLQKAIVKGTKNVCKYVDGKPTDEIESTNIVLISEDGEFQVVLPPDEKKCEEFQSKYSFGDIIKVEELVDVRDIKVSIYRDNLSVKILADYKED